MLFSMGCYTACRNPAQHLTGDWNPHTAFQYLAAFSIVAQWVQNWRLVTVPPVFVDVAALAQQMQAASQPACVQGYAEGTHVRPRLRRSALGFAAGRQAPGTCLQCVGRDYLKIALDVAHLVQAA
jgi:hypothetical protein